MTELACAPSDAPLLEAVLAPVLEPVPWAVRLGYAGLLPFIALAVGMRFFPPEVQEFCVFALAAYAATIASFLGAIHWGLAMRNAQTVKTMNVTPFAWGVVPSLVAWFALLCSPVVALSALGVLLWVCYAVDRVCYPKFQLQQWLPMRLRLTTVASMSCFYVAVAWVF